MPLEKRETKMNGRDDGATCVKALTDVCQDVSAFIGLMTADNASKDERIYSLNAEIRNLQDLCCDLKTKLKEISQHVKTLAGLLQFTTDQNHSTVDLLTRLIASLSPKNVENAKKRKMCSSYSPLKLSLKDKSEIIEGTVSKFNYLKLEKEKKISSPNKFKNVWRLQVKVDGKPSDLLKKSKQTTLNLQPKKDIVSLDITTINSPSPEAVVSNSNVFNPEASSCKKNDNVENAVVLNTQSDDSGNISLSHFNKIIKPSKHVLQMINASAFHDQPKKHDESCDETRDEDETVWSPIMIPMNVIKNEINAEKRDKNLNRKVMSNLITIPGLNDVQNDLPNYNFKEDPVRKRNERKLLNGWDCEDCRKFYEANNDNPVEAKKAMNQFSRHRSVKHQHHAPTPPGFWDPT